jgi:hypothetical protein
VIGKTCRLVEDALPSPQSAEPRRIAAPDRRTGSKHQQEDAMTRIRIVVRPRPRPTRDQLLDLRTPSGRVLPY